MKEIKKYFLVAILQSCIDRGLITIQEILDELKDFEDTDVVVSIIKD